jgi:hypothetical protein
MVKRRSGAPDPWGATYAVGFPANTSSQEITDDAEQPHNRTPTIRELKEYGNAYDQNRQMVQFPGSCSILPFFRSLNSAAVHSIERTVPRLRSAGSKNSVPDFSGEYGPLTGSDNLAPGEAADDPRLQGAKEDDRTHGQTSDTCAEGERHDPAPDSDAEQCTVDEALGAAWRG